MMVAISPQLAALSVGGSIVFPTLLLQQLKNESFVEMNVATTSWIGSIYGLSGIPVILLPLLMQWKGRKLGYILTCLIVTTGWILSLTANNIAMIFVSESFHGLGTNSLLPVSFLGMTEMLAPRYRFIAMQVFGINVTLGIAIAGILGRYFHYKIVSCIMLVPVLVGLIIAFFWPESPAWLAHKGKYDQCEKAFVWLRGTDDQSIIELSELINAQKETLNRSKEEKMIRNQFWKQMTRRDFYMPALHTFVLLNMMYWSGGEVIVIYFIEMVEKTTRNVDAAFYASIVMYSLLFLGSIVTNVMIRRFNNKTVLFFSSIGCTVNLVGVCIVTFLQSLELLADDSLLSMYFLVGFILFYGLGLNAVVFYIAAELMPVKHRSIGGALYIVINCGLYASTLKISPYLLIYIKMSGTFLIYIVNSIVCMIYVWKYVPETKGRTLLEIEEFYNNGKFRPSGRNNECEVPLTYQVE